MIVVVFVDYTYFILLLLKVLLLSLILFEFLKDDIFVCVNGETFEFRENGEWPGYIKKTFYKSLEW